MNFTYAFDRLSGALADIRGISEFKDGDQKQAALDAMDLIKQAMACLKEYSE